MDWPSILRLEDPVQIDDAQLLALGARVGGMVDTPCLMRGWRLRWILTHGARWHDRRLLLPGVEVATALCRAYARIGPMPGRDDNAAALGVARALDALVDRAGWDGLSVDERAATRGAATALQQTAWEAGFDGLANRVARGFGLASIAREGRKPRGDDAEVLWDPDVSDDVVTQIVHRSSPSVSIAWAWSRFRGVLSRQPGPLRRRWIPALVRAPVSSLDLAPFSVALERDELTRLSPRLATCTWAAALASVDGQVSPEDEVAAWTTAGGSGRDRGLRGRVAARLRGREGEDLRRVALSACRRVAPALLRSDPAVIAALRDVVASGGGEFDRFLAWLALARCGEATGASFPLSVSTTSADWTNAIVLLGASRRAVAVEALLAVRLDTAARVIGRDERGTPRSVTLGELAWLACRDGIESLLATCPSDVAPRRRACIDFLEPDE